MRRAGFVLGVLVWSGCGGGSASTPEPRDPVPSDGETRAPAPWSAPALSASSVPSVYLAEWGEADNRSSCALIAPATVGQPDATPRAATFSGGWAVAYDIPDLRSAFGVAGTGTSADGDRYDAWPHHVEWSDGSNAGYGPEGGTGPNQLAYVEIAGQDCLYNVWSRLGVDHLEWLIAQLRYVR